MQCLNIKNKEVAALLDEYTNILGSYDAAYYVLSENNGYGLDKAPNGEPSKLYNDLLSNYNNDHSMAIRAKSMVYSDNFKNWFGDWTNPLKPYNRRTSKQATVRLNKVSGEKFNVNPETMKGVILTDNSLCIAKFIWLYYKDAYLMTSNHINEVCNGILFPNFFTFFFHWSWQVRNAFYYLIL